MGCYMQSVVYIPLSFVALSDKIRVHSGELNLILCEYKYDPKTHAAENKKNKN